MAVDDLRSGAWVTYIGGRATSARLRRCRIEVTSGPDAGLVRDIEAQVIHIGARRGNDVQLTDSKVSLSPAVMACRMSRLPAQPFILTFACSGFVPEKFRPDQR